MTQDWYSFRELNACAHVHLRDILLTTYDIDPRVMRAHTFKGYSVDHLRHWSEGLVLIDEDLFHSSSSFFVFHLWAGPAASTTPGMKKMECNTNNRRFRLCFKARPSAKPLIWKFVLFTFKWTNIWSRLDNIEMLRPPTRETRTRTIRRLSGRTNTSLLKSSKVSLGSKLSFREIHFFKVLT